jgi:hypothetical protein
MALPTGKIDLVTELDFTTAFHDNIRIKFVDRKTASLRSQPSPYFTSLGLLRTLCVIPYY